MRVRKVRLEVFLTDEEISLAKKIAKRNYAPDVGITWHDVLGGLARRAIQESLPDWAERTQELVAQ